MTLAFLDTNILLYSISRAANEATKRQRAIDIIEVGNCALSSQVLQEFFVQATRPTRADALPRQLAEALMKTWLRFPIQDVTPAIVFDALAVQAAHQFSYWDSAIIAAAKALRCTAVYSEDLTHGQVVDGVRIVDPFR